MLPILISVSLAPGSYVPFAQARVANVAAAAADETRTVRLSMCLFIACSFPNGRDLRRCDPAAPVSPGRQARFVSLEPDEARFRRRRRSDEAAGQQANEAGGAARHQVDQ